MAVDNTSASSGPYYANGVTTLFPFYFIAASATEIRVEVDGIAIDPSSYTVALDGTGAGVVTISPALATGTVYIASDPSFEQSANFQRFGPYFPDFINKPLDRSAIRDIFLLDRLKRALVAPIGGSLVAYLMSLLGPAYKGDPGGNIESIGEFIVAMRPVIPAGTTRVRTSGKTRGEFIYNAALNETHRTAHPLAIFQDFGGRYMQRDPQDLRGAQFGMDPSVSDNSAALAALIAYQGFVSVNAASALRGGAAARFDAGIFNFTQNVSIKGGTFIWTGSAGSTGYGAGSATVFQMSSNVGFTLDRADTPDATLPFGGDGFVSNYICYRGSYSGSKPVFTAHARVHFHQSSCVNGGSHGLAVIADVGGSAGAGTRGEASISTIFGGAFSGNKGSGILWSGGDANACKAYGYDAVGNLRYGVEDLSFLGNTFDGHHRDNALGAFFADNTNAGTLALGTYTESGQPPAQLGPRGLIVGGTQAAGWTWNTAIIAASGGVPFVNGITSTRTNSDGTATINLTFGSDANGGAIWTAGRTGYTGSAIERFRGADIVRSLDYGDGTIGYLWTGTGTSMAFGRSAVVPNVHVFYNFSLGTRIWTEGTAAPTTGNHAQGERVWNTAPVAGGTEGWVCVASGTPGTWKTFGAIAA